MGRVSLANSVTNAALQACQLRGVRVVRLNSRVFDSSDGKGKNHLIAATTWFDELGVRQTAGLPDLLARPCISLTSVVSGPVHSGGRLVMPVMCGPNLRITVPLWIECKAASGRLSAAQMSFRDDARKNNEFYIELRDSAEELMDWFQKYRVTR